MPNLKYLFSRIANMNTKAMLKQVGVVKQRTDKSRVLILADMIGCGFKYEAGYMDYVVFEMYNQPPEKRATYITRGQNNRLVRRLNDPESWHLVEDKATFNELFADVLHRRWLDLRSAGPDDFSALIARCPRIVCKPLDATGGRGIEFIDSDTITDAPALYRRLLDENKVIVEQFIVQHPDIAAIYPLSVNTLRLVTLTDDEGNVHVVFSSMRLGNGKMVDNLNSGGMATIVDTETGIISKPAADKDGTEYPAHPHTNVAFVGRQVPFYRQSVELVIAAAKRLPTLRYLAWDVAVTTDGPLLIEANHFPGHDIYQFQCHLDDGVGLLPRFKAALGEM